MYKRRYVVICKTRIFHCFNDIMMISFGFKIEKSLLFFFVKHHYYIIFFKCVYAFLAFGKAIQRQ